MTNDHTDVDLDEMDALAGAVFGFAGEVQSVAEQASGIDYNVNTFGLIGAAFTDGVRDAAGQAVAGLYSLYRNVYADGTAISDTALDFRNNEEDQTNRFRGGEHG